MKLFRREQESKSNYFGGNRRVNQIILERTRSKLNYFGGNCRINGITSVGTVEKMKLFWRKYSRENENIVEKMKLFQGRS